MKKILSTIFLFLATYPLSLYALESSDIYSQQYINKSYIYSGFNDVLLYDNAKNHVIDSTANFILNYIFDNMNVEHSKIISRRAIRFPISSCDNKYESRVIDKSDASSIETSARELMICRSSVYAKNISLLIKEVNTFEKGMYSYLLKDLFGRFTDDILNEKRLTMEFIIDKLASNNMLSFNGLPFLNTVKDISIENIKCENNHKQIPIFDTVYDNKTVEDITIGNRNFHIIGCQNDNDNSFFKYIALWEKKGDTYSLYDRIPIFMFHKNIGVDIEKNEKIYITTKKYRFTILENVNHDTQMEFQYKLSGGKIYLHNFDFIHNKNKVTIYHDDPDSKNRVTSDKISLQYFNSLLKKYCSEDKIECRETHLNFIITDN